MLVQNRTESVTLSMQPSAVLLLICPDARGLVAFVSGALYKFGANILHADQHQDSDESLFFMRIEFQMEGFDLEGFQTSFIEIADRFHMRWKLHYAQEPVRVALFVSQHLHCYADLLHRHQMGELQCDLKLIVSNHANGEDLARFYGVPFHHVRVEKDAKAEAEATQLSLLEKAEIDLVIMARYMQILSPAFVKRYPSAIINVHHSFLPAFIGTKPYHAAFRRGVKLIGASSHYATAELDDGPIIEQDVVRISHRDAVPDLIARGRDLERVVLSRAVRWHLERRIMVYGNKTVVFD